MPGLKIGYARVSTDAQDLTAQRDALQALGVKPERIYVDQAFVGHSVKADMVSACGFQKAAALPSGDGRTELLGDLPGSAGATKFVGLFRIATAIR